MRRNPASFALQVHTIQASIIEMAMLTEDPAFPQLHLMQAPAFMRDLFQRHCLDESTTGHPIEVRQCRIGEKRHKPGKFFQIAYHLDYFDADRQCGGEQVISAKLSRQDADQPSVPITPPLSLNLNGFRSNVYLKELNIFVRSFPDDPGMPHLPQLQESEWLKAYFNRLPESIGILANERVDTISTKVMHYLPEQSCMMRFDLTVKSTIDDSRRQFSVFGKTYSDLKGEATFRSMMQLASRNPYCAPPLHYDPDLRILWQCALPGQTLEWYSGFLDQPGLPRLLARCIAAFHSSRIDGEADYGFDAIFKQLDACQRLAATQGQTLHSAVTRLRDDLTQLHKRIAWNHDRRGAVHLDLKMANLLVAHDRAYLIDLDSAGLGDPLADTGSFIANLYLNGLRAGAKMEDISDFADRFLADYTALLQWTWRTEELYWYISAALIHEVLRRSIRQQDEERLALNAVILAASEDYLHRAITLVEI
jgi:Phosphotransferase enzyme family